MFPFDHESNTQVAVVGGGMAGLTAAALLARAGRRVILFEKGRRIGGRAASQNRDGFIFNQGPHALYRGGKGIAILRELGVTFAGGQPTGRGFAVYGGRPYVLPSTPWDLVRTGLLNLPEKLELAQIMFRYGRLDESEVEGLTVAQWAERTIRHDKVREAFYALVRISTYSNDPYQFSMAAAVAQYRVAAQNVTYLDGGWQTLVEGVRRIAEANGATIVPEANVDAISRGPNGQVTVSLSDGAQVQADSVILAVPPDAARRLLVELPVDSWAAWAPAGPPVRMATLDVALRRMPFPKRTLALGIDVPLYYSLHSAYAHLAPQGAAFLHAGKYLPSDEQVDPVSVRGELEALLDLVQPGWSQEVVHARLLPEMTVMNALRIPAGDKPSRATSQVPGYDNVFVAGDWVGSEGLLVDAALASAKAAAELAMARPAHPPAPMSVARPRARSQERQRAPELTPAQLEAATLV